MNAHPVQRPPSSHCPCVVRAAAAPRCELTHDAFDHEDASEGPLAPGDVGEIEEVASALDDEMPYNVRFNGRTYW
jgi:hypothetical protein